MTKQHFKKGIRGEQMLSITKTMASDSRDYFRHPNYLFGY